MTDQLLVTFYVESPNNLFEDIAVDARIQVQSGSEWYEDWNSFFTVTQTNAHYNCPEHDGQLRRRYKIDVFRRAESTWDSETQQSIAYHRLFIAGVYKHRLCICFNGIEVLTRMIYVTIQPDVEVYRNVSGERVNLLHKTETTQHANPLHINREIIPATSPEAEAARTIIINEANDYKDSIFVKTNLPIDKYSEKLNAENPGSWQETWLRLAEHIRLTRRMSGSDHWWYSSSNLIQTNTHGQRFIPFIPPGWNSDTGLMNLIRFVELGIEKPTLSLPLFMQEGLVVCGQQVQRYTGTGEETVLTAAIKLQLLIILKTTHAVKILPSPLVLDEDNNYTSFIAVEANDGADWTFADDERIEIEPKSGTGRKAVIVRKAESFDLEDEHFVNVPLTITSTVNAENFPDFDGDDEVSDTANVHLEQYTPTRNALIPKGTGVFDHSLSTRGSVGGWSELPLDDSTFENIDDYPTLEMTLDAPHRIRSWSLQSVGEVDNLRRATVLALSGRTLDGNWQMLDFARLPNNWNYALYTDDKCRVDRPVQNRRVVDAIRISVLAAEWGDGTEVALPQIQVFAGLPVLPRMTSDSVGEVTVWSSGNGRRVFDKAVSGSQIASVGVANWYLERGNTPQNDVAVEGVVRHVHGGFFLSLCWLAVSFPSSRLIGYLYSIDDLSGQDSIHANTPYGASLYFEGRQTADENANLQDSVAGDWSKIGLISLDKCIGNTVDTSPTATTLNEWVQDVLGLTGADRDRAFIIANGDKIIQFDHSEDQWQDTGSSFTPETDAIHHVDNKTHYADFANIETWAQFRFTVKSIMNLTRLPSSGFLNVAMPEMQLFALPTATINAGDVATVLFLKAEDQEGNLHDILGTGQRLPWRTFDSWWSTETRFRIHFGAIANIATTGTHARKMYVDMWWNAETPTRTDFAIPDGNVLTNTTRIDFSLSGDFRSLAFYEMYFYTKNNEKIVISTGLTRE